jgi:hypothetical protein
MGHSMSKHITGPSEERGERNGYLGMGYFRSTSCIEHAIHSVFSSRKLGTDIAVSVTPFTKEDGKLGTTFYCYFVLGTNILTRGSLGRGFPNTISSSFFLE